MDWKEGRAKQASYVSERSSDRRISFFLLETIPLPVKNRLPLTGSWLETRIPFSSFFSSSSSSSSLSLQLPVLECEIGGKGRQAGVVDGPPIVSRTSERASVLGLFRRLSVCLRTFLYSFFIPQPGGFLFSRNFHLQ